MAEFDLEKYVKETVLLPGEEIIWKGRSLPDQNLKTRLTGRKPLRFAMSLFMVVFAVFWTSNSLQAPFPFQLFGLGFISLGLWLVSAPYRENRRLQRTFYAITTQRLLDIHLGKSIKIRPTSPEKVNAIQREDFPDGRGNLRLTSTTRSFRDKYGRKRERRQTYSWQAVDDIAGADRALQQLLEKRS
ncbi:hypothetical protein [Kiloniella sp. b19]|uniref:hypothetical protein n=1 Tax=Kiloniella sp. GXU_MW_B19 TaxID=3141326 RepID=UPI0031DC2666